MTSTRLGGLLVQPLAACVRDWWQAGKLDEEDLERALSSDARAWIDHAIAPDDWAALEDVEGLAALAAAQLGGEPELVDWARQVGADWLEGGPLAEVVEAARALVDGPGFAVAHASDRLIERSDWRYEGGRDGFSVSVDGSADLGPALRALVGACLARLAEAVGPADLDVRFEGIDGDALVVFAERAEPDADPDGLASSRLHRAALVPATGTPSRR